MDSSQQSYQFTSLLSLYCRYVQFLTRYPYVVLLFTVVVMVLLSVVSWIKYPLPDYANEDLTKVGRLQYYYP